MIPDEIVWKDTKPFVPPITRGRVIKVYDGDTITIATKLPYPRSPLYRFSVRLLGIDTPEIKTKDKNENKTALIAREKLSKKILNEIVELKDLGIDKYGRVLAYVYYNGRNLSNWLIKQRLAVAYDGGTKRIIKNWYSYYNYKPKK